MHRSLDIVKQRKLKQNVRYQNWLLLQQLKGTLYKVCSNNSSEFYVGGLKRHILCSFVFGLLVCAVSSLSWLYLSVSFTFLCLLKRQLCQVKLLVCCSFQTKELPLHDRSQLLWSAYGKWNKQDVSSKTIYVFVFFLSFVNLATEHVKHVRSN